MNDQDREDLSRAISDVNRLTERVAALEDLLRQANERLRSLAITGLTK